MRGDAHGYQLFSVDHDTGATRLDLAATWSDPSAPVPVTPEDQLLCDPDAGWLCSQLDCKVGLGGACVLAGYGMWVNEAGGPAAVRPGCRLAVQPAGLQGGAGSGLCISRYVG